MRILVTGDDGIFAEGLWTLVKELSKSYDVLVVAPDRKLNAVGTAVTVDRSIRAKRVKLEMPEIETWVVEGTPTDCVLLAIHKFAKGRIQLVLSGINEGSNQDGDIVASGTVAAALTACLCGVPALALSQDMGDVRYLENAARLAAIFAKKVDSGVLPTGTFLNVNVPNLPLERIKGIEITRIAGIGIYEDSVKEGNVDDIDKDHESSGLYTHVRRRGKKSTDRGTDVWAVQQGYISVTPLHNILNDRPHGMSKRLCSDIFKDLKQAHTRQNRG